MNIIKYLLCKNSGMSNGESFLRASTNMPISGGAAKVIEKTVPFADIITVTDALARPAVDLQSEITATQNLNGYEYPWVGGAGTNKWDEQWEVGLISASDGQNTESNQYSRTKNYIDVSSYDKIYFAIGTRIYLRRYDASKNYLGYAQINASTSYTIPSDTAYLRFCWDGTTYANNLAVNYPNTETTYQPYENICPISGRTEVNVTRTGKNIAKLAENEMVSTGWHRFFPNPIKSTGAHTFSCVNAFGGTGNLGASIAFTNSTTDATPVGGTITDYTFGRTGGETKTVVIREEHVNAPYICLRGSSAGMTYESIANGKIQIELGSTATEYEPYEGDTFNTELGRTVYGGTLDLTTGELTITHAIGDLTGYTNYYFDADKHILTIRVDDKDSGYYHIISDRYRNIYNELPLEIDNGVMTEKIGNSFLFIRNDNYNTLEEFMASLTGTQFVYKLKTPQTISLTPTEVMMLENNNTIWADSGRVQLTYYAPKE